MLYLAERTQLRIDVPKKILLVDDDPDIIALLKQVLLKEKYQIMQASNGRMAEEILDSAKVDLLVTDIEMPEIDGVELVHWLREKSKIPIIVMTSYSHIPKVKELYEEGISHFLSKPLRRLEFLDLVDRLIHAKEGEVINTRSLEYVSVPIDNFLKDEVFECPIFVKLSDIKYVKIANNTATLNQDQVAKLKDKSIHELYLTSKDYEARINKSLTQAKAISNKKLLTSPGASEHIILNAGKIMAEKIYHESLSRENFEMAKDYVTSSLDIISDNKRAMNLLEELNNLGDHFFSHCMGVSIYNVLLAKQLEWTSEETFKLLSLAGVYHDIGFKDIDVNIANKDLSELDDDEFKSLRNHPIHGADIVSDLKYFPIELSQIILQHHENCIGEGYPFNLKKDFIYPPARIVYITDLFCDLVLTREGYDPISPKEALVIMEEDHINEIDSIFFETFKTLFS